MEKKHHCMAKSLLCVVLLAGAGMSTSACLPLVLGGAASAGYMAAQSRGFQTAVNDTSIKTGIKDRLTNADYHYLTAVGVDVLEGNVLLTGVVASSGQKAEVSRVVRETPHVREVYNQLIVSTDYSNKEAAQDTWISTQVRSRLLTAPDVYSINYNTTTVKGNVFIIGLASSQGETARVLHIARTVPGVKMVHNYIRLAPSE